MLGQTNIGQGYISISWRIKWCFRFQVTTFYERSDSVPLTDWDLDPNMTLPRWTCPRFRFLPLKRGENHCRYPATSPSLWPVKESLYGSPKSHVHGELVILSRYRARTSCKHLWWVALGDVCQRRISSLIHQTLKESSSVRYLYIARSFREGISYFICFALRIICSVVFLGTKIYTKYQQEHESLTAGL